MRALSRALRVRRGVSSQRTFRFSSSNQFLHPLDAGHSVLRYSTRSAFCSAESLSENRLS